MNDESEEERHKGLAGVMRARNVDLFSIVPL